MKTFSTDGRIPLCVLPEDGESTLTDPLSTAQRAWDADTAESTAAAKTYSRYVSLPGREPMDLEAISDLWLD
jgi:hypothetical protein